MEDGEGGSERGYHVCKILEGALVERVKGRKEGREEGMNAG